MLETLVLCGTLAATPAPAPSPEASPVVVEMGGVKAAAAPSRRGLLRFSHRVHSQTALRTRCIDCHRLGDDGNRFRPAAVSTCTPCHKEKPLLAEFEAAVKARAPHPQGPREPIHKIHIYYDCARCHGAMTASEQVGDLPLPPTDNSAESCVGCHSRAVTFSHAAHVAADGKVGADCALCHGTRPDGSLFASPAHPQCAGCHNINLLGLTEGCNLCHLKDTRAPKSFDVERAATLHQEHPRAKVACSECHQAILTATSLDSLKAARKEASENSCQRCHKIPR